jgi:diguanylate cyclase (GGDEF)-like protein/PAS domain S-box-containing protein
MKQRSLPPADDHATASPPRDPGDVRRSDRVPAQPLEAARVDELLRPDVAASGHVSVRDHEQRLLELEHSVARIFAAADDPSAAVIAVIRAVCEAENWEYGRFWRSDEASGRITGADHWCVPDPALEKFLAGSRSSLTRGEGLPGRVWQSGEALWLADIRGDPRIVRAALAAETGMRSCCVFPIASEGRILGVLAFMSHQVREPDSRMLATAAVIASQAGQFLRRKNAESALSDSEQFARSTLDSLPEHLCVIDEEGTVLKVNRAWQDFAAVGGATALRVGEGENLLHACDRQNGGESQYPRGLALGIQAVLAGRQSTFTMEYPCITHAEERWFLARVSRFAGSGAVRVVVAHQEITARIRSDAAQRVSETERIKSEEASKHSEAMFRDIFDSSPVPLAVTDKGLNFAHLNPAFTQIFGYTLADVPTVDEWRRQAYPGIEYRRIVVETWRDAATKRRKSSAPATPIELRVRCKNGEERIVMVGEANLGDSAGVTSLVIFYDITDRKLAEQAVREYASQQNLIADFGHKALANTDLDQLLDELAAVVAAGLNVEFCKVLQFGPDGQSLLHKAGVGWQTGWIGGQEPVSDVPTRTSFVLASLEPLNVTDFLAETRFAPSLTLQMHGISSGIDVPILGSAGPLGIIGAYSREPRYFTPENVSFLQNLANTVGTAIDRKALELRFAYLAQFDSLTGLPNRGLLLDRFTQTLTLAARNRWLVGILFVDLDRFKLVNDTRGHGIGDALLVQVAGRLTECVRAGDTVGRLGGDEFAVVLCNLDQSADAGLVADKVVNALALPFRLEGQDIYVSASVGICVYPADGTQADDLLRNADTAMYRAKERGRNTFQFYLPDMNQRSAERLALETELRGALERREFLLHYQPKANIVTGDISGFEALLRWQHPLRGLVGPEQFISILEDTGMIVPVGEWVLRTVCEQLNCWRAAGIAPRPVAVNLSARQFQQRNLDEMIAGILAETRVDADLLELELTESMLMRDPEEAVHTLEALRTYGVALAVDDFGTGYSSLLYLQRFPLDALKIDRAFIRDITTKPDDASIAVAIITLAHSLKLKVIAEGVETEAQLDFLKAHDCDEMQGYYFSPALDIESCTRALIEDRRLPPQRD